MPIVYDSGDSPFFLPTSANFLASLVGAPDARAGRLVEYDPDPPCEDCGSRPSQGIGQIVVGQISDGRTTDCPSCVGLFLAFDLDDHGEEF